MRGDETQVTTTGTPQVTLSVREYGARDSDTHVVLLHGFPDDQRMWDQVVDSLPHDWHVVTYDSRGNGGSSRPTRAAAYRTGELLEDLVSVLDATVPAGSPVHLVGHDWGSVVGWEAVAAAGWDPRLEHLASYTSISGPPLDHLASLASSWRGRRRLLPQILHSLYALVFCLPLPRWLPRLLPLGAQRRFFGLLDPTAGLLPWREVRRGIHPAILIYRANLGRVVRGARAWRTSIPVLLVVARRDGFITDRALEHLDSRCRQLRTVELDSGHWVPRAAPTRLADLVTAQVQRHG